MIHDNDAADDKNPVQQPAGLEANSSGMVLVIVVIMTVLATILAAGLYFASGARIRQVRQEIRFEKAFFVAEAGIDRAKAELYAYSTNLTALLKGPDGLTNTPDDGGLSFYTNSGTPYGDGKFYVKVRNNTTNDPNPFVDTDHIVIIRSTGIVENAKRAIDAEVKLIPFVPPINAGGAFGLYNTNASLSLNGNASIDGNDWDVPKDFSKLQGQPHSAGTLSTNVAMPGVFYGATNTTVSTSGSSTIGGNPSVTNATGVYTETYWYQFLDTLMAAATIYTGGANFGTRTVPLIIMLPAGTTDLGSNTAGAGVLIIPGGATVNFSGTFYYEGLVLIEGTGTLNAPNASGGLNIFGAVISLGGAVAFNAVGSVSIKYSTQAFDDLARLSVPAQLHVIYWKEIKASSTN